MDNELDALERKPVADGVSQPELIRRCTPTQKVDRPWSEYPLGTKAFAIEGGHWLRVERGWEWHCGSTFPTPGASAYRVQLP